MLLREGEICPYGSRCPHNNNVTAIEGCYGANRSRQTTFDCNLVDENGNINENGFRIPADKTGKMKVLLD